MPHQGSPGCGHGMCEDLAANLLKLRFKIRSGSIKVKLCGEASLDLWVGEGKVGRYHNTEGDTVACCSELAWVWGCTLLVESLRYGCNCEESKAKGSAKHVASSCAVVQPDCLGTRVWLLSGGVPRMIHSEHLPEAVLKALPNLRQCGHGEFADPSGPGLLLLLDPVHPQFAEMVLPALLSHRTPPVDKHISQISSSIFNIFEASDSRQFRQTVASLLGVGPADVSTELLGQKLKQNGKRKREQS